MREYSTTSLSHAKDKLVAIAGAAKYLKKQHGGFYMAGLWREDAIWQLNWYVLERPLRVRPGGYRAPTWSWASVDGETVFPGSPPSANFIHYVSSVYQGSQVEHFGEEDFANAKKAALKIRCGPLLMMAFSELEFCRSRFETWYLNMDAELQDLDDVVFLMALYYLSYPNSKPLLYGLLLRRSKNEGGQYTRLGRFYITPSQFLAEQSRKEACAEEADYGEVLKDENKPMGEYYVISII